MLLLILSLLRFWLLLLLVLTSLGPSPSMAYYPNLMDNDADQLLSLFRHYNNTRPVLRARAKAWFGVEDALFFAETSYWWGSYAPSDYGCGRVKQKDVINPFMWHHIEGGIELAQFHVRHWHMTRDEQVLKDFTLPWADELLDWYDKHYPKTANGTIVMLNAKSCETYNHCTNPAPQVAGLQMVVAGLLTVPVSLLTPKRQAFLKRLQKAIPRVPQMVNKQGKDQIAPCLLNVSSAAGAAHATGGFPIKAHTVNHEAVETYPMWPYEMRDLYADGNSLGQNTQDRPGRYGGSNTAWDYNAGLVPAILGGQENARQAYASVLQRVSKTFDGSQNPMYALAGCCADGAPQMENTGIVRQTIQKMLMTFDNPGFGSKIYLMPAWPKGRDVSFSLAAPLRTTVAVEYVKGTIVGLVVTPASRKADVVMPTFL